MAPKKCKSRTKAWCMNIHVNPTPQKDHQHPQKWDDIGPLGGS